MWKWHPHTNRHTHRCLSAVYAEHFRCHFIHSFNLGSRNGRSYLWVFNRIMLLLRGMFRKQTKNPSLLIFNIIITFHNPHHPFYHLSTKNHIISHLVRTLTCHPKLNHMNTRSQTYVSHIIMSGDFFHWLTPTSLSDYG